MTYDALLDLYTHEGLEIYEKPMIHKGLYADQVILINKNNNTTEKKCILSEEIGHYKTSSGDILNQTSLENRKQERRARGWGYEKLIPLSAILDAYKAHCKNRNDIAEYLDVTEEFLLECVDYYKQKLGLFYQIDNTYVITFEPLGILERFGSKYNDESYA